MVVESRSGLGLAGTLGVAALAALTTGAFLGGSSRLSYHEAIWAQSAREALAAPDGPFSLVPTLDGRPWLEKPPLMTWLIAGLGRAAGGVIDPGVARAPSAIAAIGLALVVARLGARRFGPRVGLLAGLIGATTAWTVARGRLAEIDLILAVLVAATLSTFDRLRDADPSNTGNPKSGIWNLRSAPYPLLFFALLGLMNLAKGLGFGPALVVAAIGPLLLWDRDRATARRLARPGGWALAAILALAWPALVLMRHPGAAGLWARHVVGRFVATGDPTTAFAGESWWGYLPSPLAMLLPWTPLALAGAWRSLGRAARAGGRGGPDRLLWAWAVGPAVLVSLARARNAHYLIHALPPCSIWAALAADRLLTRLADRGVEPARLRRRLAAGFVALGVAYALGYGGLGPWLDRRGREWAFYEEAGRRADPAEPVVFLYSDWDRAPYPSPFGPMPHDLAIRLYSLGRPASWRASPAALRAGPPAAPAFAVIARDRDLGALEGLGRVTELARGPTLRARASTVDDRTFVLFRVDRGRRSGFADSSSSAGGGRPIVEDGPSAGRGAMPLDARSPSDRRTRR